MVKTRVLLKSVSFEGELLLVNISCVAKWAATIIKIESNLSAIDLQGHKLTAAT